MPPLPDCGRVLDEQEVLDDLSCQAVGRIPLAFAQIPDLLGEVLEVERHVRPRLGEAAQLHRLLPGPGEEVGLVELAGGRRGHRAMLGEAGADGNRTTAARQRGSGRLCTSCPLARYSSSSGVDCRPRTALR